MTETAADPIRIFLAAPFVRRYRLQEYAWALKRVFSRPVLVADWIYQDAEIEDMDRISDRAYEVAAADLRDVANSDHFYMFTCWAAESKGGMHVEFHEAFEKRKAITLVGPRTNIYHHARYIRQVSLESWEKWLGVEKEKP